MSVCLEKFAVNVIKNTARPFPSSQPVHAGPDVRNATTRSVAARGPIFYSILTMTVLLQDYEGDRMSQTTVDEVDGSSSRRKNSTALIVDTFFKLSFLKVLIVDIGISIGKMPPNIL